MRKPANASEENENGFRLFTRRPRRCRLAVFLALRPAAARAILTPKEPALGFGFVRHANMAARLLHSSGVSLTLRKDVDSFGPAHLHARQRLRRAALIAVGLDALASGINLAGVRITGRHRHFVDATLQIT
jgi:hypothetical protein